MRQWSKPAWLDHKLFYDFCQKIKDLDLKDKQLIKLKSLVHYTFQTGKILQSYITSLIKLPLESSISFCKPLNWL